MALELPDFPWDSLDRFREQARGHSGGIIDLSVGSPVDDTPQVARDALAAAANAPHYPLTAGSPEVRAVIASWWQRRRNTGEISPSSVIPTIGSKEMVGLLPTLLGLGPGDTVVIPEVAYPTYEVGALVAGATVVAADDPLAWPESTRLVWINSPGNPTGQVRDIEYLKEVIRRSRDIGAVVASDECYAEMPWDVDAVYSLLDSRVAGGDHTGLLALYSASKQSNLAGYRAAVMAGDGALVGHILGVRKHLGLIPPAPIQAALAAVLSDDDHVAIQRERYRERRSVLKPAVIAAGFRIDHSEAGLYVWATRGEDCLDTVGWFADRGILVTPGSFYGPGGREHVRIALTASDTHIDEAAARLAG